MKKLWERFLFTLFCVFIAAVFFSCVAGIGLVQFLDDEPRRHGVKR